MDWNLCSSYIFELDLSIIRSSYWHFLNYCFWHFYGSIPTSLAFRNRDCSNFAWWGDKCIIIHEFINTLQTYQSCKSIWRMCCQHEDYVGDRYISGSEVTDNRKQKKIVTRLRFRNTEIIRKYLSEKYW